MTRGRKMAGAGHASDVDVRGRGTLLHRKYCVVFKRSWICGIYAQDDQLAGLVAFRIATRMAAPVSEPMVFTMASCISKL